ncbi:MAG TPA: 2'-5' RNA ligase family protein [Euzebyales bacterium]
MAYALELFFDPHAEAAVRALWANLEARGMPSMATASHCNHRPHVSLLVAEHLTPDQARVVVQPLTEATDVILRLGSVAVFPGRAGVVYLGVTPTQRLLRLHHIVHTRLAAVGVESGRHYLPDVWVPHCTLSQGLSHEQVCTAVRAIKRLRTIEADVVEVGVQNTETGRITPIAQLPHSQDAT